ncbi:hypothetical protein D5085_16545 [Ectothiorhodospiraceae bacterium BW-2]|nr:hypothetical protein D5085_16545 [Ectothiorhodospiraceae bacterium BW-2]
MSNTPSTSLLLLSALTLGATTSATASGWTFAPFLDEGWQAEPTLAITAGPISFEDESESSYGIQLSLNCPWFAPPELRLRQQINYRVSDLGNSSDYSSLEINPRFFFDFAMEGLTWGIGPGFGYAWLDDGQNREGGWSLQAGAEVEYRSGALFAGAGVRYQATEDLENSNDNINNTTAQLKLGVNF